MRRLYLLRHAKSSWDDASLPDHDRPLAPRGQRAAAAMAAHFDRDNLRPALVLCSSARRTLETLGAVIGSLGEAFQVGVERELYEADEVELLRRLRAIPDDAGSVMVIAHNPGLQELALLLASGGERLEELRTKYATGALATLEAEIAAWSELGPATCRLVAYTTPRELPGERV